jgi:hypothetical protein
VLHGCTCVSSRMEVVESSISGPTSSIRNEWDAKSSAVVRGTWARPGATDPDVAERWGRIGRRVPFEGSGLRSLPTPSTILSLAGGEARGWLAYWGPGLPMGLNGPRPLGFSSTAIIARMNRAPGIERHNAHRAADGTAVRIVEKK